MEQGVLNVQPAQVAAAPEEVPLCPGAGNPVPQLVAAYLQIDASLFSPSVSPKISMVNDSTTPVSAHGSADGSPRVSVARRLRSRSTARPGRGPCSPRL